jgi:hypothetical protein
VARAEQGSAPGPSYGQDAAADGAQPKVGDSDASGLNGGGDLVRDGADAVDDAPSPARREEHQLTGSMPRRKVAIATRPGKLQYRRW